uniref:indole-3-pyruvate monooxygenase n=1 Tax=Tanacetum cinerariifolium TaxID=118510 RepID=A0A6L2LXP4_TANCI|nr:probable indole-3-pyruvate monooxygenase YUCCA10 [Tanacetum cinerariifolium]
MHNFAYFAKYNKDRKIWKVKAKVIDDKIRCYESSFLVVATGENCDAFIPKVDGLSEFKGEVIHSTEFKSGKAYKNKTVLVVEAGNSGMEIALDLANYGAKTSIIVRSPVLPAMKGIKGKGNEVVFENGKCYQFDTILFATGFKRSTHLWLQDTFADVSANTQECVHGAGVTKAIVGDELQHTVEATCFTTPNLFMGGFQEGGPVGAVHNEGIRSSMCCENDKVTRVAGKSFDNAMKKVLTEVGSSVVVEDTVKDSSHQGIVPSNSNEANEASNQALNQVQSHC